MRKSEYPKVKVIQTLDNSMEKDKGKRGHS